MPFLAKILTNKLDQNSYCLTNISIFVTKIEIFHQNFDFGYIFVIKNSILAKIPNCCPKSGFSKSKFCSMFVQF